MAEEALLHLSKVTQRQISNATWPGGTHKCSIWQPRFHAPSDKVTNLLLGFTARGRGAQSPPSGLSSLLVRMGGTETPPTLPRCSRPSGRCQSKDEVPKGTDHSEKGQEPWEQNAFVPERFRARCVSS